MVDVLILTHNEEANVAHAIESVRAVARNVFVVDSGSTDGTVAVAREMGARVIAHAWEGYSGQRNWALDDLPWESEWILILDADESLTPGLASEIMGIAAKPVAEVKESAFFLNRVLIFMGQEIRHCGYFPSWSLRLFKRGRARYEPKSVHEHLIPDGPTAYLKNLMRHEDRRGLEHYIAKHNRYSTLEARELYRQEERWPGFKRLFTDRVARRRFLKYRVATKLATPWFWRFFYMYVVRFGFLDRQAGLNFCLFISSYELTIRMKYRDLLRMQGREQANSEGLAIREGTPIPPPRRLPAAKVQSGEMIRRQHLKGRIMRQASPWTLGEKAGRLAWGTVQGTIFRFSPHNAYGWRRMLLRVFGAKLGADVRIRRTVKVEIPWNLTIGDHSVVGDEAILYCLGAVTVGRYVTISQYAHLCAGTHETGSRRMKLLTPPIAIGDDVWVAADAFVGPGVTIGERTILGARASAFSDLPADVVAVGMPAKPVRAREFESGEEAGEKQAEARQS
jgi:acetyltransferase-like isoleucine patch superfamily enzyme/glycosyltransferase involved in cell wall biosynthesis